MTPKSPACAALAVDRFAEHFHILADAPNGVPKLREMILQLAIQGRLVRQNPKDEPASVLLKKIKAEKEKLIKEGKISKQKPLPPIDPDGVLYELPKGWEWVRLPQVVSFDKYAIKRGPFGSAIKKDFFVPKGYKVYEQKNAIYNDFSLGRYYIGEEKFKELEAFEVEPNDIIISCSGTVGKLAVAPEWMEPGVINQALLKLTLNNNTVTNEYFVIMFEAHLMRTDTLSDLQGTAQKNITSVKILKTVPMPLPPLAEQKRIVAKVDELMALCDELEARQQKRVGNRITLNSACLNALVSPDGDSEQKAWQRISDNFDLLYDCPENVSALRQAILQLAVIGKLVSQGPKDEPASVLLEKIATEKERLIAEGKIKKPKPLPPIKPDEMPYELPEGWEWARVNDVSIAVEYGTSHRASASGQGVPVLRMNNVQGGKVTFDNLKYVPTGIDDLPRLLLDADDILFNRTNSYELVGKAGIFRGQSQKYAFASYLIRLKLHDRWIVPDYVNRCLNARYFRATQIEPAVTQQCGQANFSGGKLKNALLPVPPLAEQKRIVAKVDELMALCDELEAKLIQSQSAAEMLMGAVVNELAAA